ncbi:MAG TPA: proton-conducting transporter membrane subunit [Pantanalinema sp.]
MSLAWLLITPLAAFVAVLSARSRPRMQALVIMAMALCSCILSAALFAAGPAPLTYAPGGWGEPLGILLRADPLSRLMLLLTGVLFSAGAACHLGQTWQGGAPTGRPVYHMAFPLLLLALNCLFMTADFFNFYVCFELVAVSSYLLVAMGKHAPFEAAWKYSAQSVIGSICLLTAICLLYSWTGALSMADVTARLETPARWAAPLLLVAFLLKGAIFPFHFWQPDAHAAATTPGSVLLAGLLVKVGLYGLLRFWPLLLGASLEKAFLVIGAASILFGAIAAWRQSDAKRLLGFSTVSQLGFVLLGLGMGSPGALGAAVFFLVAHSLAKSLLFLATGSVTDRVGQTAFAELEGAGRGMPMASAGYLIGALSLVGMPLTAGFVGKIGLLAEGARLALWPWVGLLALASVMTLGYCVRAYQCLFWGPAHARPLAGRANLGSSGAIAALSLVVLLIGVAPAPLWEWSLASADALIAARLERGAR